MIYKRGEIFWIKYYSSGKPIRESSHSTKESDAKRLLRDREGRVEMGVPILPKVQKFTVCELLADLKAHYETTGQRTLREAETRLRALPRVNQWVFPSAPNPLNHFQSGEWSVTAVEHAWQKIRRRVGLQDVRIYDLRRTAASWLAINGSNLPVIQQMLNHRSLSST